MECCEDETIECRPGPSDRVVRDESGRERRVPKGWDLLPPGDAAATRRVKKAGPHWVVRDRRGRRWIGLGVWAPGATIRDVRTELESERADPAYAKKLEAGRARRAKEQSEYVTEFRVEVLRFLDFSLVHHELGESLATAIAEHATPVGSGTVARTRRIPIERRVEAATIAWMRHQTTAYDSMKIARVKGRRREVRRMLAERSRELLDSYRRGDAVDTARCPLARAIATGGR
ncbi:MAG: DUF2293 domain-containing protein [Planctomycetota bacterium]